MARAVASWVERTSPPSNSRSLSQYTSSAEKQSLAVAVYFMIPSYATTLEIGAAMPLLGATASSVAMACRTISKLVLGAVGERAPHAAQQLRPLINHTPLQIPNKPPPEHYLTT